MIHAQAHQALLQFRVRMTELHRALQAAEAAAFVLEGRLGVAVGEVPAPPRIHRIQEVVADHFGFTRARMLRRDRHQDVARTRMVAMTLCRELTRYSLESIGLAFGGMDHGTVISAAKAIGTRVELYPDFAGEVAVVRGKVTRALAQLDDEARRLASPAATAFRVPVTPAR